MPRNTKKCQETKKVLKFTKRFGSGSGFFEAPVHHDIASMMDICEGLDTHTIFRPVGLHVPQHPNTPMQADANFRSFYQNCEIGDTTKRIGVK